MYGVVKVTHTPPVGYVGVAADSVVASTRAAVAEGRLFRCLICSSLSMVPAEWLTKGGMLYQKAAESSVNMTDGVKLSFPFDGISAKYSSATDSLTPLEVSCFCCTSTTRKCSGDGSIIYENGDRTQTVSAGSRCGCGYMHYWDGEEYDNLPERWVWQRVGVALAAILLFPPTEYHCP